MKNNGVNFLSTISSEVRKTNDDMVAVDKWRTGEELEDEYKSLRTYFGVEFASLVERC